MDTRQLQSTSLQVTFQEDELIYGIQNDRLFRIELYAKVVSVAECFEKEHGYRP